MKQNNIIKIICYDVVQKRELIKALQNKTAISWDNDSKIAPIGNADENSILLLQTKPEQYQRLKL